MTTFIEFHALRSFPPSNLNRDDLGSPKTAVFGGVRRLRISSQCLKRTWRTSEHFRGAFAEEQLGIRTERLPEEVLRMVGAKLDEPTQRGLLALLGSIGRKGAKPVKVDDDGEPDDKGNGDIDEASHRTAHLLFLSRQEVEAVAAFALEKGDALTKAMTKKKPDAKAIEKLRKELQEHLQERTTKNAVDIGLFGRFVTSDELDTIDGALQVAHALGTQRVDVEPDYFTAVDDLGDEPGAGHLGETEIASSVLYLYACCDLDQLEHNLGARDPKAGRRPDAEARALARRAIAPLASAIAAATPRGKKTGTAPHTPAEYVEVVVRRGAPLSFANAFTKPVDPRDGDVMDESIARLARHRDRLEKAYGRDGDMMARFVLCLRDVDGVVPAGHAVETIGELAGKVGAKLEAMTGTT